MLTITTEDIWRDYHNRLRSFIQSRVNSSDNADDILQDVFLKIHASIDKLKDLSNLKSWLYQITKHTIIDYHRTTKFNQELTDDVLIDETESNGELMNLISTWIRTAANQLEPDYRDAVLQADFNNISQKKIAETTGISYSGVKSRIQRGREKIKDLILDCCHLDFDFFGNVYDYKCKRCECDYEN